MAERGGYYDPYHGFDIAATAGYHRLQQQQQRHVQAGLHRDYGMLQLIYIFHSFDKCILSCQYPRYLYGHCILTYNLSGPNIKTYSYLVIVFDHHFISH